MSLKITIVIEDEEREYQGNGEALDFEAAEELLGKFQRNYEYLADEMNNNKEEN